MITRRHFNAIAGACAFMASIAPNRTRAQGWPTHPVRLIVPFAAGGPTDVIGRIVGERLSKTWGQQVLIENRPGGGTNIANEIVARSEPDGHTILMGGSSQATTRVLYRCRARQSEQCGNSRANRAGRRYRRPRAQSRHPSL